jgi:hypothetical protein
MEPPDYHHELLAQQPELGGPDTSCAKRVERMAGGAQPAASSKVDVLLWDPSGESLVEVTDSQSGVVRRYWMRFDDDRWLVGGEAH